MATLNRTRPGSGRVRLTRSRLDAEIPRRGRNTKMIMACGDQLAAVRGEVGWAAEPEL